MSFWTLLYWSGTLPTQTEWGWFEFCGHGILIVMDCLRYKTEKTHENQQFDCNNKEIKSSDIRPKLPLQDLRAVVSAGIQATAWRG